MRCYPSTYFFILRKMPLLIGLGINNACILGAATSLRIRNEPQVGDREPGGQLLPSAGRLDPRGRRAKTENQAGDQRRQDAATPEPSQL